MKVQIKKDETLGDDTILIIAHPRNFTYAESALRCFQKNDAVFPLYDDLHNLYHIAVACVYYMESIDNKVYMYTKDQMYRSYCRFSHLKNRYHHYGFHQINKNTLVNTYHIDTIQIQAECRRMITLDNGERLIVNRHFAGLFKEYPIMQEGNGIKRDCI